ncbi:hypothetical protein N431DRAFT_232311 [Stipitochalara longipes BDJ]|nr:hypothetical protein N431DRAFT_232311 [Stipitochalara longipes BDJ]
MPQQQIWKFSCNHELTILEGAAERGFMFLVNFGEAKAFSEKCPICREADRQAECESKKNREEHEQEIKAYRAHKDFLQIQIDNASATPALKREFGELWRACASTLIEKLKKADANYGVEDNQEAVNVVLEKRLGDTLEMIKLHLSSHHRVRSKERLTRGPKQLSASPTHSREWVQVHTEYEALQELYEAKVKPELEVVATRLK